MSSPILKSFTFVSCLTWIHSNELLAEHLTKRVARFPSSISIVTGSTVLNE